MKAKTTIDACSSSGVGGVGGVPTPIRHMPTTPTRPMPTTATRRMPTTATRRTAIIATHRTAITRTIHIILVRAWRLEPHWQSSPSRITPSSAFQPSCWYTVC